MSPLAFIEFPLNYMEPFKPINMDIELSVVNSNIEDDLNIEYGLQ